VLGVAAVVLALVFVLPAAALTEARIIDVSCAGLTVVQTGLPPDTGFEVTAVDAAKGRLLTERLARSSATGDLRVRLRTGLHGVHRLHAEVERTHVRNAEYGEADVDLGRHCRVVGRRPVSLTTATPAPSGTPAATPATSSTEGSSALDVVWWVLGGTAGLALATWVGVVLRRRRKLP
jgi:hypothetical protein